MKNLNDLNKFRVKHPMFGMGDDTGGLFIIKYKGALLSVIASTGEGWDHVSVSLQNRCPTWEEMSHVKRFFFRPEETAVMIHPPESEYVNVHPYCLHWWRSLDKPMPLPEKHLVA